MGLPPQMVFNTPAIITQSLAPDSKSIFKIGLPSHSLLGHPEESTPCASLGGLNPLQSLMA
ncbi:hypothetical protein NW766_002054 [Fusarium irregulare]|uniref:Uncharacterized protein n=1 Tax=Fusarium irregulare TaxID=2494466 RepID=A0A9W8PY20_9HYPO|nr:hypothetical protein NW766_002054 [Fusarium irregulare]